MEKQCVFGEVGTELLNIIWVNPHAFFSHKNKVPPLSLTTFRLHLLFDYCPSLSDNCSQNLLYTQANEHCSVLVNIHALR
jgi:hypothetical protein